MQTLPIPTPMFSNRPLFTIAEDITKCWPNVNYAAVPYLQAMHCLTTVQDAYGQDNGRSIVRYFLSNATSFRGVDARRIKAELNKLLN